MSELPLDQEQLNAVNASESAIAVLAGPGSGKTRVLSYRAQRLLSEDGTSSALLLTFTNKAAAEMKARALGVTVVTTDRIEASTYHTFSMRLLQRHGNLVGLGSDFEILDDAETAEIVARAGQTAGVVKPHDRAKRWSYLRLRRLEPPARERDVIDLAAAYQDIKRADGVLDFDDLLVGAAGLLESNPEVAESIGRGHPHILIDEFQDTNPVQFAIVRSLWQYATTVSVFADDDQGIYQFAGAEPAHIRQFIDELGAQRYSLTTNYRCREQIVEKANRLIAANPDASGRAMRAEKTGGEVRSRRFDSLEAEADALSDEIASLIEDGQAVPSDVAVLSRRRTRLSAIVEALEARRVPLSNWLGPAFEAPERQALTTCLYVIRASLTDRQCRRFCELLNVEVTDARVPMNILAALGDDPGADALARLRDLVWGGARVSEIVDAACSAVRAFAPPLASELPRIVDVVDAFEAFDAQFGIDQFLAELALGGAYGSPVVGGGVKIASLHRTKGLQWQRVYLVGLEDQTLPDFRADTPLTLAEERRTCFVGICRAEDSLTLTRVPALNGYAKAPSAFLTEMGFDVGR